MPVGLLVSLSARNLFRHRRRNAMLLAAIAVAVAGVTVLNSLVRGMQEDMRDAAVGNLTGHVKVLAPGYRDDPGIMHRFLPGEDWKNAVPGDALAGWAARVVVPAVIMSERETRGLQLVGVNPARESISFLADVPVLGERLNGPGDNRILVGRALADQLETDVGYRVVVITRGADGSTREAGFRVAGIFDADGTALEKAYAFTGLHYVQSLLGTGEVTELSLRLRDDAVTDAVVRDLRARLADLRVLSWQELEPQAAAMYALADTAIYIWFLVMMGALIFGLVNTLITAVMERTRELGMLRAVGMQRGAVLVQVVLESALVMAAGVALGLAAGALLTWMLRDGIDLSRWAAGAELARMSSRLVPRLLPGDLALLAAMSLGFGVLASLYPAWRAVKIEPLEAMRR